MNDKELTPSEYALAMKRMYELRYPRLETPTEEARRLGFDVPATDDMDTEPIYPLVIEEVSDEG